MRNIYKRINTLRKKCGITWDALATMAGIPVSSWMTGLPSYSIPDEDIRKIAPVLGTTYEYLKTGKK